MSGRSDSSHKLLVSGSTRVTPRIEVDEEFCLEAVHEDGMNRLLPLALASLVSLAALAQQHGPEGTNNNQNSPIVNTPATSPTNAQKGSTPDINNVPSAGKSPAAPASGSAASGVPGDAIGQSAQPTTELVPAGKDLPSADPVLERKGLPRENMSLIGGRVVKVDRIRNRVDIQPFGGGKKFDVRFDERSHIYRDGRETTMMSIAKGDRIYADTMLVEGHVFARNLRVETKSGPAESRGQVISYNARSGRVEMRDTLTGQVVSFFVTQQTAMNKRGNPASPADLRAGTLLDVMFAPGAHGGKANQVSIMAVPGEVFIFAGRVTNLDLSRGVLNVDNENDQKNYEMHFNPAALEDRDALRVGREIEARARFDGQIYRANQVTVIKANAEQ